MLNVYQRKVYCFQSAVGNGKIGNVSQRFFAVRHLYFTIRIFNYIFIKIYKQELCENKKKNFLKITK